MSRIVPWLLVALCFALTVASRSISDTFAVFVPALQDGFAANRSSVTVVYSFALFAGGTGAPLAGWIVDRFGLRALTVTGMAAVALGTLSASYAGALWQLDLSAQGQFCWNKEPGRAVGFRLAHAAILNASGNAS